MNSTLQVRIKPVPSLTIMPTWTPPANLGNTCYMQPPFRCVCLRCGWSSATRATLRLGLSAASSVWDANSKQICTTERRLLHWAAQHASLNWARSKPAVMCTFSLTDCTWSRHLLPDRLLPDETLCVGPQCFYGVKELRNALQGYADAPAVPPSGTQVSDLLQNLMRILTLPCTLIPVLVPPLILPFKPTLYPSPNLPGCRFSNISQHPNVNIKP